MRKLLLLFVLSVLNIAGTWAEERSEREARTLAMRFLSGLAVGQSDLVEVTLQGQVSGLYVFSLGEQGGFIIVSNDDRTLPILGFSENGTLDLENMPDEQRAWLQGYADEIVWLQQHNNENAIPNFPANTRAGSHDKEDIAPMVTTTWGQRAPYNNLCPDYAPGKRSVTGCVATAMAQVMNYHQWPVTETEAIPGYRDGYGVDQTPLEATTFDWENMMDSYSGSSGDQTTPNPSYSGGETAVAKLMQYCGYSVEMNYGPSSGSCMFKVAPALKDYFDYNGTTTYISRSSYSNDKWEDIISHELASHRPVLYGGQSTGGGHAFVCDGYRYEYAADYFHINWGWGGKSDEYYVLSVLNPYSGQGTGGSSSQGGFYFGQEAIIGIQKSTDSGTLADITPAKVDLTPNSMTLSSETIFLGETATITLNVTNNSADDFDGDIYVGTSGCLLVSSRISIPAGQTQDCTLTYKPTAAGAYGLIFFEPMDNGYYGNKGGVLATLTVIEETTPEPVDPEPVVPETCPAPENLTVSEITATSAVVSWEGSANSYDVRYGIVPEGTTITQEWLQYDNDNITVMTTQGLNLPETTWGVMYPGSMVTGTKLTKIAIYETMLNTEDITVNIYSGGDDAPGTLLHTETVTPLKNGFHEVTLSTPVTITAGENLWITLTEKGKSPIACYQASTVEPNNQWICYNGKWYQASDLYHLPGFDYCWRIRGFIEAESLDDVEWSTPANCTELSYTLTDLTSGKNYMVQVRGNNGNEDVSQWEAQTFSTLVDISQPEAINSVIVKPEDGDVWYSLDGRRLNGKPTTKGVYIRPVSGSEQDRSYGKKVVMK